MQSQFDQLSEALLQTVQGDEVLLLNFDGERSDFVRLNHGKVRQGGQVEQRVLQLRLVVGQRHVTAQIVLSGQAQDDLGRATAALNELRAQLPLLPEDPHLLYNREVQSSEHRSEDRLPPATEAIDAVLRCGGDLDLVGIWASGGIYRGFCNSLGQRNWFETASFHLDWSLYHEADKATKQGFAGTAWDEGELALRMDVARAQLAVLGRPSRTVAPGAYRAYLAPAALNEIVGLIGWGGFSLKEQRSKRSPLLRAVQGEARLHPSVSMQEHTGAGLSPPFSELGFVRPERVTLFEEGAYKDALVSPRSAQEYGRPTNGADSHETPTSLEMGAGTLPRSEVLAELGTGLYINNLWYLNYSDRPACRMTGMTRFATLWVEDGQVVAPVRVMRFDDSLYRMLGDGLLGLTAERDLLLDAGTYGQRSTSSTLLPGALIEGLRLTL